MSWDTDRLRAALHHREPVTLRRSLLHRGRLHQRDVRRQSARGLSRRRRDSIAADAGDRERAQPLRDGLRVSARESRTTRGSSGSSRRAAELPFAGHPRWARRSCWPRSERSRARRRETSIVFEEGVGPVPVTIRWESGQPDLLRAHRGATPRVRAAASADRRGRGGPLPPPRRDPHRRPLARAAPRAACPTSSCRSATRTSLARARPDLSVLGAVVLQLVGAAALSLRGDRGPRTAPTSGPGCSRPGWGFRRIRRPARPRRRWRGIWPPPVPPENGTLRWVVDQGVEMGRPSRHARRVRPRRGPGGGGPGGGRVGDGGGGR